MAALLSLLVIVTLSLIVTRVGVVALAATGLSRDVAKFQARSAFSGVGFTTSEAECVVNHPVRRRIIMWLVLLGNAGFVTTVASLMLSFNDANARQTAIRVGALAFGLFLLWRLESSAWFDRLMSRWLEWAIRRYTRLDLHDYDRLLHVSGDYAVAEVCAKSGDWLTGRSLRELDLREEGVIPLGIHRREGRYLGAPPLDTVLEAGDRILVYGRDEVIESIDERHRNARGEAGHAKAVEEEDQLEESEERELSREGRLRASPTDERR